MLYALLAARPEEANAVHKRAPGVDELNCLNKAGGCKRSEEGTFLDGRCCGDHLDFPRQPSSRCTFSVPGGLECQGCIHRGRGVCNDKCSRAEAGGALAPHQTMPPLAHPTTPPGLDFAWLYHVLQWFCLCLSVCLCQWEPKHFPVLGFVGTHTVGQCMFRPSSFH